MNTLTTIIASHGSTLATGALAGTFVGIAYFAGLSMSIRHALNSSARTSLLAVSAIFRIALMLLCGWLLAVNLGVWAVCGYGAAFLLVRTVTLFHVRLMLARESS